MAPGCLRCCRPSRTERAFRQARHLLERETNINSIIKQHRYFKLAFKRLLSKNERRKLKDKTMFRIVDPDCTQDEEPSSSVALCGAADQTKVEQE